MSTYPIIENPKFKDLEKTTIRTTLVYEDGSKSIAEFKVPENQARGVNEFWDKILDGFDIEEMSQARDKLEELRMQQMEFQDKKRKAAIQSETLRQLFDKKMGVFNSPFMVNATAEEKAAVRRAPSDLMLSMVVASLAQKYMQDNNLSFIDLFDQIDDMEYQAQLEAGELPTDPSQVVEPTA